MRYKVECLEIKITRQLIIGYSHHNMHSLTFYQPNHESGGPGKSSV